jgi:hypothetical protein
MNEMRVEMTNSSKPTAREAVTPKSISEAKASLTGTGTSAHKRNASKCRARES